jgi:hypothetical protein
MAILLTALVLHPIADRALAQEEEWVRFPYRFTFSVDAGVGTALQPSPFDDLWNTSFPATAALGYVIIPRIEVKAWFTYAHWGIGEIPALNAIGDTLGTDVGSRVKEIDGGSITTVLFGGSAKIVPFPNSRILPYVEVGGGYFRATAEDLSVVLSASSDTLVSYSMPDADGPVFTMALGMEYAINERWNAYAEFNYYLGASDTFAPGELVRPMNSNTPAEAGNLQFISIALGIVFKM